MNPSDLRVLVPIKRLADAKQRLSHVLTPAERAGLVLAMLGDVIAAARGAGLPISILSPDPDVLAAAMDAGADPLWEAPSAGSLNKALRQALQHWPAAAALVILGDTPTATAAELSQIAAMRPSSQATSAVIVGDHREEGTNALLLRPPTAIRVAFGPQSFTRHQRLAAQAGVHVDVVRLPGLGLDIDDETDLRTLLTDRAETLAQRFLRTRGIAVRLGLA